MFIPLSCTTPGCSIAVTLCKILHQRKDDVVSVDCPYGNSRWCGWLARTRTLLVHLLLLLRGCREELWLFFCWSEWGFAARLCGRGVPLHACAPAQESRGTTCWDGYIQSCSCLHFLRCPCNTCAYASASRPCVALQSLCTLNCSERAPTHVRTPLNHISFCVAVFPGASMHVC